jgi:serine/threonine protein kinase
VAVKVFRADVCSREAWDARVRRGAELRAGLSHPNLVPVRGAGWWDGRPYVAVEFVPQGSLVVKPDGKLMPVRQALHLVEQLGEVVGYLHRQGVVHGNLKPSNVLLAAGEIPRVVDPYLTGGLFLGPRSDAGLAYLAPELLDDPALEPRQNTDVYGLGLILYELLTGRPAMYSETGEGLADEVRYREPVPPSQLNPAVTDYVDAVCLKCLRKNPWRRYTRTYDFVKRLREFQSDHDVVDPPSAIR